MSNHEAQAFPLLRNLLPGATDKHVLFDRILCDVPCSGACVLLCLLRALCMLLLRTLFPLCMLCTLCCILHPAACCCTVPAPLPCRLLHCTALHPCTASTNRRPLMIEFTHSSADPRAYYPRLTTVIFAPI